MDEACRNLLSIFHVFNSRFFCLHFPSYPSLLNFPFLFFHYFHKLCTFLLTFIPFLFLTCYNVFNFLVFFLFFRILWFSFSPVSSLRFFCTLSLIIWSLPHFTVIFVIIFFLLRFLYGPYHLPRYAKLLLCPSKDTLSGFPTSDLWPLRITINLKYRHTQRISSHTTYSISFWVL
jgi:hypothetical protein